MFLSILGINGTGIALRKWPWQLYYNAKLDYSCRLTRYCVRYIRYFKRFIIDWADKRLRERKFAWGLARIGIFIFREVFRLIVLSSKYFKYNIKLNYKKSFSLNNVRLHRTIPVTWYEAQQQQNLKKKNRNATHKKTFKMQCRWLVKKWCDI